MKYRVKIHYTNFTFNDIVSATDFAKLASENNDEKVEVSITFIDEKEDEE